MIKLRSVVLAAFLFAALPLASAFAQVGISINIAPPVLPVYEQPPCPVEGYIWTPGYWAWAAGGYYWVPGVWAAPPAVGLLWTPAWWGWNNGAYIFHEGYWGPTVGFYGGINYGHGYWGDGYWGGHWEGNNFQYNTAVTRVNNAVIHNTYADRNVITNEVNRSHTSFNGGNGVKAEPTAEQKAAAENARKSGPTSQQLARQEAAARDPRLQASNNKGHPNSDAIRSFNQTHGQRSGKGAEGTGTGAEALKPENKPGNMAEHHGQGARNLEEHGNKVSAENRGKKPGAGGATGPPHTMNKMSHNPQMGARNAQMGGKHPQPGGGKPPQMGGGNRPHPSGGQQQGKKKNGKP
jgi:WXXGXW repeat (2 copies)